MALGREWLWLDQLYPEVSHASFSSGSPAVSIRRPSETFPFCRKPFLCSSHGTVSDFGCAFCIRSGLSDTTVSRS